MKYSNAPLEFIRDFVSLTSLDPSGGSKGFDFLVMLNEICGTDLKRLPDDGHKVIDSLKPTLRLI